MNAYLVYALLPTPSRPHFVLLLCYPRPYWLTCSRFFSKSYTVATTLQGCATLGVGLKFTAIDGTTERDARSSHATTVTFMRLGRFALLNSIEQTYQRRFYKAGTSTLFESHSYFLAAITFIMSCTSRRKRRNSKSRASIISALGDDGYNRLV